MSQDLKAHFPFQLYPSLDLAVQIDDLYVLRKSTMLDKRLEEELYKTSILTTCSFVPVVYSSM